MRARMEGGAYEREVSFRLPSSLETRPARKAGRWSKGAVGRALVPLAMLFFQPEVEGKRGGKGKNASNDQLELERLCPRRRSFAWRDGGVRRRERSLTVEVVGSSSGRDDERVSLRDHTCAKRTDERRKRRVSFELKARLAFEQKRKKRKI